MDKLASSVFRRYFAKLDAPTEVTVNGHTIGVWVPAVPGYPSSASSDYRPSIDTGKATQAQRDAILRRINRGG